MSSIGWLHLADLHQTVRRRGWPSAQIRHEVLKDLARLHDQSGPWHMVIVAGDLSMRGSPAELDEAERTLEDLLEFLRSLGSNPALLAVPGNHDMVRADAPATGMQALRRWRDDPRIEREFWTDPDSPGRRLVDRALSPWERWWDRRLERGFGDSVTSYRAGLLPGDFTVSARAGDLEMGVAGLCSTFLHVSDGWQGRLSISPHQATIAAGGDLPAWVARHDACVLLTHHAPDWLDADDRNAYDEVINPPGRFAAHLSAHFHDGGPLIEVGERPQIRCPSFFGLDSWEGGGDRPAMRRFGYNVARLSVDDAAAKVEVWPRIWSGSGLRPAFELSNVDPEGSVILPLTPILKLGDVRAAFSLERAALRDALAALYPSREQPRRLARKAGLRERRLTASKRGGAAIDLWHSVVIEAERQGVLGDLVKIVSLEHPSSRAVQDAYRALERSTRQDEQSIGSVTRGVTRSGFGTDEGSALYAKLIDLPPAAFEAVLTLLSLTGAVPPAHAPQASRAVAVVRSIEQREGPAGLERLVRALERAAGPWARGAGSSLNLEDGIYRGASAGAVKVPALAQETLSQVYQAAARLGVGRHTLLAGLPPALMATLPLAASRAAEILVDLQTLNRTPPLADGTVPLLTWLSNARALSAGRPEAEVFRKAQEELRKSSGAAARVPTRDTLIRLLTVMFSDERDFDGFVLDHYPTTYRRFNHGMSRAYRIGILLEAADPSDIVARLKRSQPSNFNAHQRVLDYEEPEVTPDWLRGR